MTNFLKNHADMTNAEFEKMPCYMEGCAEEFCHFFNAENLIKYLKDEWEEYQNAECRKVQR